MKQINYIGNPSRLQRNIAEQLVLGINHFEIQKLNELILPVTENFERKELTNEIYGMFFSYENDKHLGAMPLIVEIIYDKEIRLKINLKFLEKISEYDTIDIEINDEYEKTEPIDLESVLQGLLN